MNRYAAQVADIHDVTPHVRHLSLRLLEPPQMAFLPGQFVSFEIERPGRAPLTRAYSIASPPWLGNQIELLVDKVNGIGGSRYLFGLEPGRATAFRGPVGAFTLRPGARDLLLVATGTGIAPLRSMLWSLVAASPARRVTLFWGLRTERDLYLQDELAGLGRLLPRLSVVTTLSQPSPRWDGARGRVGALVETAIDSVSGLEAFLCGNGAMIAEVTAILRRKGICPIHSERYYDDRPPKAAASPPS